MEPKKEDGEIDGKWYTKRRWKGRWKIDGTKKKMGKKMENRWNEKEYGKKMEN